MYERTLIEALEAVAANFVSPNELDSNLEPANVVDGLYRIARGLWALAQTTCGCEECLADFHPRV